MQVCTKGETSIILLTFLLTLVASCDWPSGAARETPPAKRCERNLKWIGIALLQYKKEHGRFPPSVATDKSGNKYSWRVALAPTILALKLPSEEANKRIATLQAYRYNQAWDSPQNVQWAKEDSKGYMLGYLCPTEPEYAYANEHANSKEGASDSYNFTSYLMLVRAGGNSGVLPDDAIIVVESVGSGILWHEPKDIDIKSLVEADSPFGVGRLNSIHPVQRLNLPGPKVVKALRADGKVVDIPKDISKEELRRLLLGSESRTNKGVGSL